MKSIHLLIPDLLLPPDIAAQACAGLRLPALEAMLGRGRLETFEPTAPEVWLRDVFGHASPAAVSAAADGLGEGVWMRADPAHLQVQRNHLLLLSCGEIGTDEAAELCAALNAHFAEAGLRFFAPHPQRWYLRLDRAPEIRMVPPSRAFGRNVRGLMPDGAEAAHWHRLYNEMQMLLFVHPLNAVREGRGLPAVNSVWLWGAEGDTVDCAGSGYDAVCSDDALAERYARAAGVPFTVWPERWCEGGEGAQLLFWSGLHTALHEGGIAAWRDAVQAFETDHAQPLWRALRAGRIDLLRVEALAETAVQRVTLKRADAWAFWRGSKRLALQPE